VTFRLPPSSLERVRAYASGDLIPVPPRPAATVVLLRDFPAGLQAYLLRRHSRMAFAAGMYAFPGGSVDPRDADRAVAWAWPDPAAWAERLGCDESLARVSVCAAVRELFEESGVLLAGRAEDEVVADTTGADWEADRQALVERSLAFVDLLDQRGLVLRSDLLGPWAHWVTPEFEERRYDTRFFVAALPPGQRTRDVSGEADRTVWMSPADAVARVSSGEMTMLPPTFVTLRGIGRYATVAQVIAAAADREIRTVMPRLVAEGDTVRFVLPDGVGDEGGSVL
jgi:8-oxo-dGTP pyrophosphatase MutT (NUDIX family)